MPTESSESADGGIMADTDQVPGLLLGEKNLTLALLTVAITKAHQPAILGSSCGDGSRMSSIKSVSASVRRSVSL